MVDYTFQTLLDTRGLAKEKLSEAESKAILTEVYTIWAIPSDNAATPPPHSTGAAIDITLVDEKGQAIQMGGEIDEISERSHPDHYIAAKSPREQSYHQKRVLLAKVMEEAGFSRHKGEWWHFSLGDQMWAWSIERAYAIYGRVED